MPLRMRFLFIIILFVFVFVVFILTSVDNNERTERLEIVHNRLINLNQHIKNEIDKKGTRTENTKKATASRRLEIDLNHLIHLNQHEVDEKVATTVSTEKPTTSSSSQFVRVLNKLNPGNHTLSTRQGKCADIVCSNFLSISEMNCAKAIAARMEPATRVTPRCHFQNGTMKPRVLLRSYPASGNTWTRQLLEKTSGICTGN